MRFRVRAANASRWQCADCHPWVGSTGADHMKYLCYSNSGVQHQTSLVDARKSDGEAQPEEDVRESMEMAVGIG